MRSLFARCLVLVLCGTLSQSPAKAQQSSAEDLVHSLSRTAPLTRTTRVLPLALDAEAEEFLRRLPTRGLTVEARTKVVEIAQTYDLPQVDINILFDFDKDTLRADALADVITIGRALTAPKLVGQRFVVAGHADGAGSASYNLDLSQRRAETVRRLLVESFNIPASRVIAVGFGLEQLKNPLDPRAEENRRVELINLEVGWE